MVSGIKSQALETRLNAHNLNTMSSRSTAQVRRPAVAGLFYPGAPAELDRVVKSMLHAGAGDGTRPKALIVPHAGYVYSGPVAARAYALLQPLRDVITRVVLLGPSHRVPLYDLALPCVDAFETPLGPVPLDRAAISELLQLDGVRAWDEPHAMDHALEVQLPFLQSVLGEFALVPIAVGQCSPAPVAAALDMVWGGPETLVVVSTDLSHFHAYRKARELDAATVDLIVRRQPTLTGEQACGCHALNGLLLCARRRDLAVELVDQCNSGDTAGGRDRVVGYASFAVHGD